MSLCHTRQPDASHPNQLVLARLHFHTSGTLQQDSKATIIYKPAETPQPPRQHYIPSPLPSPPLLPSPSSYPVLTPARASALSDMMFAMLLLMCMVCMFSLFWRGASIPVS